MTETRSELQVGQAVFWGLRENFQTGKIIALSHNGQTAFVKLGQNIITGKNRFITVSTRKLQAVNHDQG